MTLKSTPTRGQKTEKPMLMTPRTPRCVGVDFEMTGFLSPMGMKSTPSWRGAKLEVDFDTGVLTTGVIGINSGPDWQVFHNAHRLLFYHLVHRFSSNHGSKCFETSCDRSVEAAASSTRCSSKKTATRI
jgi:hypothetical protein